jgi:DnaJ-class molecular chaperone
MTDYYSTLGVAKDATQDEIKAAYRKMAAKHHPDRAGGDTATFQKIQAAYDIIGDEQKRREYDNPFSGRPGGMPGGFGFNVNGVDININDIFGGFGSPFADMFRQQHQNRKPQYRTRVNISLKQSIVGGNLPIHINTPQNPTQSYYNINIPQGIQTNQSVRYENLIPGADLLVDFFVMNDPHFSRHGLDVHSVLKVSALELLVGTTYNITTIWDETLEVTIPPLTQPTSKLRINGKGVQLNGTVGNHLVLLEITIPDTITEQLKNSILTELGRI